MDKKKIFAMGFIVLVLCLALIQISFSSSDEEIPDIQKASVSVASSKRDREIHSITCRIVSMSDDHTLILAGQNASSSAVYRLSLEENMLDFEDSSTDEVQTGMLITVSFYDLTNTYPVEFEGIRSVRVLKDGANDLCHIYLQVLNDLWDEQSIINENISQLGVSLSKTRLSTAEQNAVAWAFGEAHSLEPILGTYDELVQQGYIDGSKMFWQDGCLFTITEAYPRIPDYIRFDAGKMRSDLGVCFFTDCTVSQDDNGKWSVYEIGSRAVS